MQLGTLVPTIVAGVLSAPLALFSGKARAVAEIKAK